MEEVFHGGSISWRKYFMEEVFHGGSISWRKYFMEEVFHGGQLVLIFIIQLVIKLVILELSPWVIAVKMQELWNTHIQ